MIAAAAARLGAVEVTAIDSSPRAVQYARLNTAATGRVRVVLGSLTDALAEGQFDVVVCNPPYVPVPPGEEAAACLIVLDCWRRRGAPDLRAATSSTRCVAGLVSCLPAAGRCCWCSPSCPTSTAR